VLAIGVGGARAAQTDFTVARGSRVVTVVWGIISYTRWPKEKGPLRVCVPEGNRYSGLIFQSAREVSHTIGRKISVTIVPRDAVHACDVAYFSAMPAGQAAQSLQAFAGSPVLTIGEGSSFCTEKGMFCLLANEDGDVDTGRFAANLDAISRSQLRVNPQVLRLSRHVLRGN